MSSSLVARAKNPAIQVSADADGHLETKVELEELRLTAARMLGRGFRVKQVAKALTTHLSESGNERSAYMRLRRWMNKDQSFRDLIYQEAVVKLDLNSPLILGGIAKSAARGRVDAARLALEITGRHTKDDAPVTQVAIILNNVARPEKS